MTEDRARGRAAADAPGTARTRTARGRDAGFAVHLTKPVPPDALRKVLADLEPASDEVGG